MVSRRIVRLLSLLLVFVLLFSGLPVTAGAINFSLDVPGTVHRFDKDAHYEISERSLVKDAPLGALSLVGNLRESGSTDGFRHYLVHDGLFSVSYRRSPADRNIGEDKTKVIGDYTLDNAILSGAILVQSSRDRSLWHTEAAYTDVFADDRVLNDPLFTPADIQIQNGWYYRVIVAYPLMLQGEVKKNAEVYEFYVVTDAVSRAASPADKPRKQLGTTVKTELSSGYTGALPIGKEDPHFAMNLGTFVVNGYAQEAEENGISVFRKAPEENVALWFTLEQDIDCLNDDNRLSIAQDTNGYALHSDPVLSIGETDMKRGALILRHTDKEGHTTVTPYYDFLAAYACPDLDTRLLLKEEGDYEVSLLYKIEKCNTRIGSWKIRPSYTDYKIHFRFRIENSESTAGFTLPQTSAPDIAALTVPAYAPIPQLPANGSLGSDFDILNTLTTRKAYNYMDTLAERHPTYVVRETMGRDMTGEYECNRYVLSKTFWKAWVQEDRPHMFAWKNGSTVIYSLSVSPRIGDSMYAAGCVGEEYGAVSAVNCLTVGTTSTRTVNGLEFARYASGDVAPSVVYTRPWAFTDQGKDSAKMLYDDTFAFFHSYTIVHENTIQDSTGVTYRRYPFADKKSDGTSPLSIVIWANEHGNIGDNRCPSVVLMRMCKDLCENTDNLFLRWLKDNAILTVIPVANPWGFDRTTESGVSGYPNGNGVNLNRNFDTPGWANYEEATDWGYPPGAYAGSENETQYLMNTLHLAQADVAVSMHGIPMHRDTIAAPFNATTTVKGCGFDPDRVLQVTETLWNDYQCNIALEVDELQSAAKCGKSCGYIEHFGAVGGLTETIDWESGTTSRNTAKVMELGYTELLQILQLWIVEAMSKV